MGIFVRRGEMKNLLFCKFEIVSLFEKKVFNLKWLNYSYGYYLSLYERIFHYIIYRLLNDTSKTDRFFLSVLYTFSAPCSNGLWKYGTPSPHKPASQHKTFQVDEY